MSFEIKEKHFQSLTQMIPYVTLSAKIDIQEIDNITRDQKVFKYLHLLSHSVAYENV